MYFLFFLLLPLFNLCAESREDLLARLPTVAQYQDILIDNQVVLPGFGPDSSSRYVALQRILDRYHRPITVLEIGARQGYFSLRIAHDYDATCMMIEESPLLLNICKLNASLNNLILLQNKVTVEELKRLSECAHFDLILALNVAHHMQDAWQEFVDILFELGDEIVIETPSATDIVAMTNHTIPLIETYLVQKPGWRIIAKTMRYREEDFSRMFWFSRTLP